MMGRHFQLKLAKQGFLPTLVTLCLTSALGSLHAQPLGTPYATESRYDTASRLIGTFRADPDGAGPLQRPAVRNTYNSRGMLERVETGTLSNAQAESVPPAWWPGFTLQQQVDYAYDGWGRKLTEQTSANGVAYALTQYSYDTFGRLICTAVRMNPSAYSSLPGDACTPGQQGVHGADRITRQSYDSQNRLLQVQRGVGTPEQINYASYTYSTAFSMNRGPQDSVTDANGNKTVYAHDGLVRQTHQYFPSATTPGTPSTSDYEQYGYDNNGNRTSLRKRDGRTITSSHDALNRVRWNAYPAGGLATVRYEYDLRNLLTVVRQDDGVVLTWSYDGFGRVASASSNQGGTSRTLAYPEYDREDNRLRITHPDGQFFTFEYDGLNRMQRIRDSGGNELIALTYGNNGQRQSLSRGGGVTSTVLSYDPVTRLTTLNHDLAGSAQDETRGFSYNPASQMTARTLSNAAYVFAQPSAAVTSYVVNGLNQYTQLSGGSNAAPTHDANGNMTWDGTATYAFDILNRLTNVSGSRTLNLAYDPKGRLFQTSGGNSGTTQFLYDGDALVAEYNAAGALTRRYVHGPSVDEPLVWYDGAGTSSLSRRYYHADHQRSVTASADAGGTAQQINTYDAYGIPGSGNVTRFQYTGQIMLPDVGLYHYKARVYNPRLGRFLQTDPVGYKDDLDLYTYVADDPMNKTDPTGLSSSLIPDEVGGGVTRGSSRYGAVVERGVDGRAVQPSLAETRATLQATREATATRTEGRYEFPDKTAGGKPYVGQSCHCERRLSEHQKAGRYAPETAKVTPVEGGKTAREVSEHKRIQEITGGVPARKSDAVSNQVDPVGPTRQHLLKENK